MAHQVYGKGVIKEIKLMSYIGGTKSLVVVIEFKEGRRIPFLAEKLDKLGIKPVSSKTASSPAGKLEIQFLEVFMNSVKRWSETDWRKLKDNFGRIKSYIGGNGELKLPAAGNVKPLGTLSGRTKELWYRVAIENTRVYLSYSQDLRRFTFIEFANKAETEGGSMKYNDRLKDLLEKGKPAEGDDARQRIQYLMAEEGIFAKRPTHISSGILKISEAHLSISCLIASKRLIPSGKSPLFWKSSPI